MVPALECVYARTLAQTGLIFERSKTAGGVSNDLAFYLMRILHVIPSLSPSSGGPSVALPAMARSLVLLGVNVTVLTTDDDGPGRRLADARHGVELDQGGWNLIRFPKQTEFYKVSLPMRRWLHAHVHEFDLVHIHAVFSFVSLAAGRAAAAAGVPFIVRPLGVLNRWGMENRRRRVKALSFRWLELPLLRRAAAVHYTSQPEKLEAARFGLTNLQCVIPIGIDPAPFASLPPAAIFVFKHPETARTRNILFLSRIDVKKGLDLLITAFARIAPQQLDVRLIICGEGDPAFIVTLKNLAASLGVAEQITWAGQVAGEMRLAAFAAAQIFVLPSHSENFGIALLEAMAAGLPCISTDQVALAADAARDDGVKLAAREASSLAEAMNDLFDSKEQREALSHAAQNLVRERYSLTAMGHGLHQLYQDIIHPSV
jgi:glycosyltransferase involved in cell wall biosynthesis